MSSESWPYAHDVLKWSKVVIKTYTYRNHLISGFDLEETLTFSSQFLRSITSCGRQNNMFGYKTSLVQYTIDISRLFSTANSETSSISESSSKILSIVYFFQYLIFDRDISRVYGTAD